MNKMIIPILKTIYKKREGRICLLFSLMPLLLIVTSMLPTNFMQLSAERNSLSFLEFFDAVEGVLFQMVIPTIAFLYLTVTCFHDEIKNGEIYIFKDIPRMEVFGGKIVALIMWYFVYVVLTFIFSLVTYYVFVDKQAYSSHLFVPSGADLQYIFVSTIGVWFSIVIILVMVAVVSLKANNGLSLVVGILFALFCVIAPDLDKINYFFPSGYKYLIGNIGILNVCAIMLFISMLYLLIEIVAGGLLIKKIEF